MIARQQAEKWFQKAEEDEQSMQAILKENGPPSTICFLAQQMAEKYLKGLLLLQQQPIRKVHDLLQLETLLSEVMPAINNVHEDLVFLNRYYVTTRYPADVPEFKLLEAVEAQAADERVQSFAVKIIS